MGRMRVEIAVDPLVVVFAVLYALAGSLWQWVVVFASLLVHEISHAVVAAGFGLTVTELRITPIGAAVRVDDAIELRAEAEAAVAMAGPMTSLVLAGAGYILLVYGKPDIAGAEFFIGANIVLALLNLVPAFPLDGGRVLRALLTERMGVPGATRTAVNVSRWIGGLAVAAGAVGAAAGALNPLVMAMGVLVWVEAGREARSAPYAAMRSVMRKRAGLARQGFAPAALVAASPDARAGAVLGRLSGQQFAIISVVAPDGREVGRLSEIELMDGVCARGPGVNLGTLVRGSKH
jgi:stage IV sporulation protein FB